MIRPVTVICMMLAAGSGLYLYQTKHQAQMLDREIVRTLKSVDADRQRTGLLKAQYAMLNDPEHLGDLATQLLPALKTTAPGQFAAMGDLDSRLPPVGLPAAPVEAPLEAAPPVVAMAEAAPARPESARPELARPELAARAEAAIPTAPRPPQTPPAIAAAAPPAATTVARVAPIPVPRHAPVLAAIAPPPMPQAPARPYVPQQQAMAAAARPVAATSPYGYDLPGISRPAPILARAPMVGSALGMARGLVEPAYAGPPASGDGQR